MEFSIVEGKRQNSLNYSSDGYRYVKYRESNGTIYLRCTLSKKWSCHGLAKISSTTNLLEVTKSHSHSKDDYKSESIVLSNSIKRSAEVSTENLREIFNNECRDSPAGCTLTFRQLESTMVKRRRKDLPKLPSTCVEFAELLPDSPFSGNHRFTVREGNEAALVFATDLLISKLPLIETIHFDGTFKVVPHLFYQLFTIFIQYKGHVMPAVHILMTNKTEQLYFAVLSALREYIPDFKPMFANCDFERASRNAFISSFPDITLIGCWFHYTKAIYGRVKKLGLGKLYKTNKYFKKWIQQLMAFPFLLDEDIKCTFQAMHPHLTELSELELELVDSFKRYFVKNWIDGSHNLSVFFTEVMTNNGAESYHNTLRSYLKTDHPNIWKFMSSMTKVFSDFDLEIKRLDDDLQITRIAKLKTRLNAYLRTGYKTKYLNKEYSAVEYINYISLTIGKEKIRLENESNDENYLESDLESSEIGHESSEPKCHVCLQELIGNFALLHENHAHAGFCEICANILRQEKHECPICRGVIVGVTRVFQ